MAIERTLVLLKPDAVQRGLCGPIITRLEATGLKIVAMKLMQVDEALARRHYSAHDGKPFFPGLIKFITSSPIVAMVLEGKGAIALARKEMGETDPAKAAPGSIRAMYATDIGRNIIHGSADAQDAQREISIFFSPAEIIAWRRDSEGWITES